MFTEQYRPQNLNDLWGQNRPKHTIGAWLRTGRIPRTILISGPTGTGKTTLARILARAALCSSPKKGEACMKCKSCEQFNKHRDHHQAFLEMNAASERGIADMRDLSQKVKIRPLMSKRKVIVMDECFPAETLILTDYDKAVPIKQIVEDENITHVLGYDLKSKSIKPKRITARFARPYHGKMAQLYVGDEVIRCTEMHKLFVVGRGYIPVKEIHPGDRMISYDGSFERLTSCKHCGERVPTKKISAHIMREHRKETTHAAYTDSRIGVARTEKTKQKISDGQARFFSTERGAELRSHLSESRKGLNNPVFRYMTPSEVSEKMSQNSRAFWDSLSDEEREERIKTFINAPKFNNFPNLKEQAIIDLDVTGLKYVGDGALFMTLTMEDGSHRKKNPDFVYKEDGKVKKIIEVMDFEYWHSHEEATAVTAAYAKLGYDCLVVDAARIGSSLDEVRGEVEAFCNNHYVTVSKVEVNTNHASRGRMVYDIEVEDTHNFFAVMGVPGNPRQTKSNLYGKGVGTPILSSNCHQITKQAWQAMLKPLEEPPEHTIFLILTTDPQKLPDAILGRCSKVKLSNLTVDECVGLMAHVSEDQGLGKAGIEKSHLEKIARAVKTSPRQSLHVLDQVYTMVLDAKEAGQTINTALVNSVIEDVAVSDVESMAAQICRRVLSGLPGGALGIAQDFYAEADEVLLHCTEIMRQAMLLSTSPKLVDAYYRKVFENLDIFSLTPGSRTVEGKRKSNPHSLPAREAILEAYLQFTELRIKASLYTVPVGDVIGGTIAKASLIIQKFLKESGAFTAKKASSQKAA